MPTGISRRLSFRNAAGEREVIAQDAIGAIAEPVIILGDPGSGKSVLTRALGEPDGFVYFRAGAFVRSAAIDLPEGCRIIIDGLDEIASTALGGGVDAVLARLSTMGAPPFILSCREADWRGASDRIKIEDDYAALPRVLHLEPFDRDDAVVFLQAAFPSVDALATLDHLSDRGLEDIYRNPLTLRLLGEVARDDGALPNSRAQLLDRACHVMLREENPRHEDAAHTRLSDDALLLGAGALCAVQLLCDRAGVLSRGPAAEGWVRLADLAALPLAGGAAEALHTRLFQAEAENRFIPIHRVIAEYLGARWIARCFESGVSERRIFSLFLQGDGVPTSLRGLHAWTAHFSDALAPRCIAADPYAVLRYGDADTLGLEQARALLTALTRLSTQDPHFRSGDWVDHSAFGLMRPELADDLLAIITTPRQHTQLTALLLSAMARTPMVATLTAELRRIALDSERYYVERLRAGEALLSRQGADDPARLLADLLNQGDADSARLAGELLGDIALADIPDQLIVEVLLAHIGLSVRHGPAGDDDHSIPYIHSTLGDEFGPERLSDFLDLFTDYAWPLTAVSDRTDTGTATDFVRKLVLRRLQYPEPVEPARLWRWLRGVAESDGYENETRAGLAAMLQASPQLRTDLIRHVMAGKDAQEARSGAFDLRDVSFSLWPGPADIADLLRILAGETGLQDMDREAWEELLVLSRREDAIPLAVMAAAIETAAGDPLLLVRLAELAIVEVPPWKVRQAERDARLALDREARHQSHRDAHIARADEVARGHWDDLEVPAQVYLGRISEFPRDAAPGERLAMFLGEPLATAALDGFIAVLGREDLPDADEIARLHADNRYSLFEAPMICAVAEMIRRGLPLETLSRTVLEAAMMAWRRSTESNVVGGVDLGSALEAAVFTTPDHMEAHFRRSIEPQLPKPKLGRAEDLYWLCNTPARADIAGRLCAEWLVAFPGLPDAVMSEMMHCALDKGSAADLAIMLQASRASPAADYDALRHWLAADFDLDFEARRADLEAAAAGDPAFFWVLRPRIERQRHAVRTDLSVAQLHFVIAAFGRHWPHVPRPSGGTIGDSNPWDATAIIERAIYLLGNSLAPEATQSLQTLIREEAGSGYGDTLRHALSLQRKARRDHEYIAPTIGQLTAVMEQRLPESIDDMRAYFADRIETFQTRVRGGNTDMWQAFWRADRPETENICRNRLVDYISGLLPPSVRFEPEMHMPGQKRADIAAIRNAIGLPVEIKGQWHPALWTAPVDQLAALYARDWHAQGRGAYVVLWFGPDVRMPAPPCGSSRPTSSGALRDMLVQRLPEERRALIDVHVLDLSRPS